MSRGCVTVSPPATGTRTHLTSATDQTQSLIRPVAFLVTCSTFHNFLYRFSNHQLFIMVFPVQPLFHLVLGSYHTKISWLIVKARAPLSQASCGPKDVCSQKGILLPLFIEVTWPWWLRVLLYFSGLLYSFVAVNIIADIFMCSIESISSKTKGRQRHTLRNNLIYHFCIREILKNYGTECG